MRLNITSIKVIDWLLPLLAGVGLFFINIKPYHDWGDDFAQYLQEAENLAQGKSLNESSYRFNSSFPRIGPKAYPPGFPLLLYTFSLEEGKVSIIKAQYLLCFFGIFVGLFAYLLFISNGIKRPWALGFTLLLLYHPYFINQKSEIISDIPFTAFLLAALTIVTIAKRWYWFALAGLFAGLAISTRSVGWVLPISALIFSFLQFRAKKSFFELLIFTIISAPIGFVLNYFTGYYSVSQNGYSTLFGAGQSIWTNMSTNFDFYLTTLERMLVLNGNESLQLFLLLFQKLTIAFLLLGALLQLKKKVRLLEVITFFYLGIILIYPYAGGYRFLLPVLPIFILWIIEGFKLLQPHVKFTNVLGISFILLCAISYYPELKILKDKEKQPFGSPQLPEALALYSWLDKIPDKETVLFGKPRALAYYTKQSAIATEPNIEMQAFNQTLSDFDIRYVIESIDLGYPILTEYVQSLPPQNLVYQNFRFKVWVISR